MPPFENEDDDFLAGLYGLPLDDDASYHSVAAPRPVPLTGVRVDATVQDFIAEVKLSQCFHNDSDVTIEAIYHFPIDNEAAVCGFEATYEDGTIVKGVVKEKQVARQEYRSAKRTGKQANLLESVRRDVFSLSVGNLPAGGFVKINVTYVTTLQARDDAAAFILPTSIAPRYTPMTTQLSSSDAQALAPPESTVKLFGLDVHVDVSCLSIIGNITCPTHSSDLNVTMTGKKGRISLNDISMDRDVVLLIEEAKAHQPRAAIEVSKDGTMTGLVTFYPQIEFSDQQREFIFVIDQSGSMRGQQIKQARDTLLLFLRSLPANCKFNIVGFGSTHESLFTHPQAYNDVTLEAASKYAARLDANLGGTEIVSPLRDIFGRAPPAGVQRQVFVLTDGQVSNDVQVFNMIRHHCASRTCRLFSVGVGQRVSRHLVTGMARAGHGTSRFVEDGSLDTLRVKVLGQLKQSLQPALDNVSIKWVLPKEETKLAAVSSSSPKAVKTLLGYRSPTVDEARSSSVRSQPKVYPSVNPQIFNNEKYVSYAMFPPGVIKPDSVMVKCETSDGPLELVLHVPRDEIFHGSIARKLAARTAITEFEESRKFSHHYRSPSPSRLTISESHALQLALSNDLASDMTSFIAISEDPVVAPGSPSTTKVIPQHVNPGSSLGLFSQGGGGYDSICFHDALLGSIQACGSMAALGAMPEEHFDLCRQSMNFFRSASEKKSWPNVALGLARWAAKSVLGAIALLFEVIVRVSRRIFPARGSPLIEPDNPVPVISLNAPGSFPIEQQGPKPKDQFYSTISSNVNKVPAQSSTEDDHNSRTSMSAGIIKTQAVEMMQMCILQKADGSFVLNDDLIKAAGMSKVQVDALSTRLGSPDAVLFATALALVALRVHFAKKRSVWELQEQKALAFLASSPSDTAKLLSLVDGALRSLISE